MRKVKQISLFIFSVSVGLVFSELLLRKLTNKSFGLGTNFITERVYEHKGSVYRFDKDLGWSNQENLRLSDFKERPLGFQNVRQYFTLTTDEYGFRSSPNVWSVNLEPSSGLILAEGDSFTFGDEVSDDETWSTHLQAIKKVRVVNGGVSSFGLDQIFIKIQRDLPLVQPKVVILSVMGNTLKRTTLTHKISSPFCDTREKPFFVKAGSELRLERGVIQERIAERKLDPIRTIFGHSVILDSFFNSWFRRYWNCVPRESDYPMNLRTQQDYLEISCLLLKKILRFTEKSGVRLVVVGQAYWNPHGQRYARDKDIEAFLKCASNLSVPHLNFDSSLEGIFYEDSNRYQSLFFLGTHMTNQGNLVVAQEINQAFFKKNGNINTLK
ncbi:MAG: hypothetical protein EBR01_08170 [Proteobacteria bacterium]|nr:hypothetical protein [Pseudomonadota bacterium]